MPAEGIRLTEEGRLLTSREVLRLAKLFVDAGVTKIRCESPRASINVPCVRERMLGDCEVTFDPCVFSLISPP